MLDKLMSKIKKRLIKFLGIDGIVRDTDKHIRDTEHEFRKISLCSERLNAHEERINLLHNTISNVVSVGSDIHQFNIGRSWAVVCVEGKYNVVKFIDLSNKDGRDMLRILKSFEGGRHIHDTPLGFFPKDMFL